MGILVEKTQTLATLLGADYSVQWVDVTTSTNDDVKCALKRMKTSQWLVRVAQGQTKGRGTHGREWETEEEALLLSIGRQGRVPGPAMTLVLGWTLLQLCRNQGADVRIKWPNDLYIDGRKLAGILCETSRNDLGEETYVIGVGINLQGDKTAHAYLGIGVRDKVVFCAQVIKSIVRALSEFSEESICRVVACWHEFDLLDGQWVLVLDSKNQAIRGKVMGISTKGELVVQDAERTVFVLNGSVQIIRKETK